MFFVVVVWRSWVLFIVSGWGGVGEIFFDVSKGAEPGMRNSFSLFSYCLSVGGIGHIVRWLDEWWLMYDEIMC